MAAQGPLYLGLDLSTQQLKGIVIDSHLHLLHEAKVDFDDDLGGKYGLHKGVQTNAALHEVFAPVALWLDAIDLLLSRLREAGLEFGRIAGISGAGMQHGTVFWSDSAEQLLSTLDPSLPLAPQLAPPEEAPTAFAHPLSPNWQDASTSRECAEFDAALGDAASLALVTGSKAHHRFSGPQILRFRRLHPARYAATARISLVSSFLASVFLGRVAPIDCSDVTGMNLWDLRRGAWHDSLLALVAGDVAAVPDLRRKLGAVPTDGGAAFGTVSPYFVARYHFPPTCQIIPFTGDNPATILSLPLHESDAMVSLGTSTTFLMSTARYRPDPAYHMMTHPTTPGLYMFMLCYKNGGLAREHVRDALNLALPQTPSDPWAAFTSTALTTPPLARPTPSAPIRLGLFFPRPEIVPRLPAGQWRYTYDPSTQHLARLASTPAPSDARTILESQLLSLRLRSQPLLSPRPHRLYLVGGGSSNTAIATLAGDILGPADGVWRLEIGGNACALGAAYKAVWGVERSAPHQSFDALVGARWRESEFVRSVADGYRRGVWEGYEQAAVGLGEVERRVESEVAEGEGGA